MPGPTSMGAILGQVRGRLKLIVMSELVSVINTLLSRKRGAREKASRLARKLLRYAGFFAIYGGVQVATGASRAPTRALAAFSAQACTGAFSWSQALLLLLHGVAARTVSQAHLSVVGITLCHLAHNFLMSAHAELINPAYVGLWMGIVPKMSLEKFLSAFSTRVRVYPKWLTSDTALAELPSTAWKIFLNNVRAVLVLYSVGFAVPALRRAGPVGIRRVMSVLVRRTLRTSAVLTILPMATVYSPLLFRIILRLNPNATPATTRTKLLHTLLSTAISVPAFLAEPKGRLRTIVVYTWWRVAEAFVRWMDISKRPQSIQIESNVAECSKSEGFRGPFKSAGKAGADRRRVFTLMLCALAFA